MDHDPRDFQAIVLQAQDIPSVDQALDLLPKRCLSKLGAIQLDTGNSLDVRSGYYYSLSPYTTSPVRAKAIRDKSRGYRHDLYGIGLRIRRSIVTILAVPYMGLAREVYQALRRASYGMSVRFQRVDLQRLLDAVTTGRHEHGNIRLTRVEWKIEGDAKANRISLAGPDVPHSHAYTGFSSALDRVSLTKGVRKCRVLHENESGKRFWIEADHMGRFSFHIAVGGRNLIRLPSVLSYLYKEDLVTGVHAIPAMEMRDDQEEDE
jgi:hypothetical protein